MTHEFAEAIVALHEEATYARCQAGAREFALARPWSAVAKPLLDFCARPRRML